uniref:Uncharacterized protein n=1 Tax=Plectus sambesii TaxID=2011161 RepID=A0A914W2H6_9BILA
MGGRALMLLCWMAWLGPSLVHGVTFFASTKYQEESFEPTPKLNELTEQELQDVVNFCALSGWMKDLPPIVRDGCAAFLRSMERA